MAKKKVFKRVDLAVPMLELTIDEAGAVTIDAERIPPERTTIRFPSVGNASSLRAFSMDRWYGLGFDEITYGIQSQLERFLETGDGALEPATVAGFCHSLKWFFEHCRAVASSAQVPLTLKLVDRLFLEGFVAVLKTSSLQQSSQRSIYQCTKAVLVALGRRGVIDVTWHGEDETFPANPFPYCNKKRKGYQPLTRNERKAFTAAVKTAVMPLLHQDEPPTSDQIGFAMLAIALHTGRNTSPLLELSTDCLRPHPKANVKFLVCYKRRGHKQDKVPVRVVESTSTVWSGVVRLIERLISLSADYRHEAPEHLRDRLFIYRSRFQNAFGPVVALNHETLRFAVLKLVEQFDLKDDSGNALVVNVSRLRKTFSNRIFDILEGDLATTAVALGNSPQVAGRHYLQPDEAAEKNWRFMGSTLAAELATGTLGASEKTPTGRCSDSKNGQFAPKSGAACMNFLSCFRCRNYVVTGDDLHRLYSFYWLLIRERDRVDRRKWQRAYAHVIRLIDRDIIESGVARRVFSKLQVESARERGRVDPHPYWACADVLEVMQ